MSPEIPLRRRSFLPSLPIALGAVAVLVIGFVATMIFLSRPFIFTDLRKGAQSIATHFENFIGPTVQYIGVDQSRVEILRPTQPGQIDVIDGIPCASMARRTASLASTRRSVATRRVAMLNAASLK